MLPQEPTRTLLIASLADSPFPEHLIPLSAQLVHSDTQVFSIPLVRGYRSNDLICDDWLNMPREEFDEIFKGFA
jgi:hypothetical protein